MAKITKTEDPLNAKIELEGNEHLLIEANVRIERLYESIFRAKRKIEDGNYVAAKTILAESFSDSFDIKEEVDSYLDELKHAHVGDCTCVPASCSRCAVESFLGIDTIEGIDKYMGNQLQGMFIHRGLEEAYADYKDLCSKPIEIKEPWYKDYIATWDATRQKTLKFLEKYVEDFRNAK